MQCSCIVLLAITLVSSELLPSALAARRCCRTLQSLWPGRRSLRGGGDNFVEESYVEVQCGGPLSLHDTMASCPARVVVCGAHTLAPGKVLRLRGRSCSFAAPFELRGEDFSAKINGAVLLENATGTVTELEIERSAEDPKSAREHLYACVEAVGGNWSFMQTKLRSAGGVALHGRACSQVAVDLSEVGGIGDACCCKCEPGTRGY